MNDYTPAVPPVVRSVAYWLNLFVGAVVLLSVGLAPIWLGDEVATKVVASGAVVTAAVGFVAGALGVAYRPTKPVEGGGNLGD